MVARIAPSPIVTSVAFGGADVGALNSVPPATASRSTLTGSQEPSHQLVSQAAPPPAPPGEAFAAAVIAGQLSPRPTTTAELARRLGSTWQAPASSLRLLDRSA